MSPRVVGYKERVPFNYWDCLVYGSGGIRRGLSAPSWRLFGSANLGNLSLTNGVLAGQFPSDVTAIITNWYARTNIPDGPLRDALFNMATATLNIGCHPYATMSVADLMKRQEGTLFDLSDDDQRKRMRDDAIESVARLSYEAHLHHQLDADAPDFETLRSVEAMDDARMDKATAASKADWTTLEPAEHDRWRSVARAVHGELNPRPSRPFCIVPVRQSFDVLVDVFNLERFNDALVKLDDPNWDIDGNRIYLLSAPKGHPADRPGVWIHLEGWMTRDVY